jgi:hypothetical protein
MKKLVLALATILILHGSAWAQQPLLELDYLGFIAPLGPSTAPVTVPFSLDQFNDNVYTIPPKPLSITMSFRNQQFTGLPYANISTGLVFGGGATLSTNSSGDTLQKSDNNATYDLLGTYGSDGGPKWWMFHSDPYATPSDSGVGFDVDGNLFSQNQTGGFQIFTAGQVLFDQGIPINSRVYFGDIVITFSEPVRNPAIHVAGLGGSYTFLPKGQSPILSNYRRCYFTSELELVNPDLTTTLLVRNNDTSMVVVGNNLYNNYPRPNGNSFRISNDLPAGADNFGAMTGSIRLNGVVKEIVYRVYLKGSPNGTPGFNWSAYGLDKSTTPYTQFVDNAIRNPFTGDIWFLSASLRNPGQQLSGTVFNDIDGVTDSSIMVSMAQPNKGVNPGGLFANCINVATGNVIATMPIGSDGSFLFDTLGNGQYKVQISTIPGTVGNVPPAATLPMNWINTGEKNGTNPGVDGPVNGESAPVTLLNGDNITNINFGIEQLPNSDPKLQTIPNPNNNVIPQGTATNSVSGSDPEQGVFGNAQTIVITGLPANATVLYNNVPMQANTTVITNFNPALLSYTGITPGSTSITFNYAYRDAANAQDPTPTTYTLQWSIPLQLAGIEIKGNTEATTNKLNINLGGNVSGIKDVLLYRKVNNDKEQLIATLPFAGPTYDYSDVDVNNSSEYTYYAVAPVNNTHQLMSNIVKLNRMNENSVVVFPNPATTDINVSFSETLTMDAVININTASGKLVSRTTADAGTKAKTINIAHLAAGNYTIQIMYNDKLQLVKFVKE